ncbi:MAG: hypothetical protein GY702_01235 [Desulfobulbaceae bacterium]|nr:hypothetical protein [Desulfobulbaceae bacterium]
MNPKTLICVASKFPVSILPIAIICPCRKLLSQNTYDCPAESVTRPWSDQGAILKIAYAIPVHGKATMAINNAAIGNLILGHFFELVDKSSKQAAAAIEPHSNRKPFANGEAIVSAFFSKIHGIGTMLKCILPIMRNQE